MLRGDTSEWHEVKPGLWIRVVGEDWMEEDGVIALAPHMSFADYWKKRATEEPEPVRDLASEIDELKAKLAEQETTLTSLSSTRTLTK